MAKKKTSPPLSVVDFSGAAKLPREDLIPLIWLFSPMPRDKQPSGLTVCMHYPAQ